MSDVKRSMPHHSSLRTVLTVLWALVPALTFGLATPIVMIHAATRMRDARQTIAAGLYLVTVAVMLAIDRDANPVIFNVGLAITMVGGTAHAFAIRRRTWDPQAASSPTAPTLQRRQKEALAAYDDQQAARERAREIAENDPRQAIELRIGRPDIANRRFPDGGLIDVNNVPVHVIASALRLSASEAEAVARTRASVGGFSSVADLSVTMNLTPRRLDTVAPRLVFLPAGHS